MAAAGYSSQFVCLSARLSVYSESACSPGCQRASLRIASPQQILGNILRAKLLVPTLAIEVAIAKRGCTQIV